MPSTLTPEAVNTMSWPELIAAINPSTLSALTINATDFDPDSSYLRDLSLPSLSPRDITEWLQSEQFEHDADKAYYAAIDRKLYYHASVDAMAYSLWQYLKGHSAPKQNEQYCRASLDRLFGQHGSEMAERFLGGMAPRIGVPADSLAKFTPDAVAYLKQAYAKDFIGQESGTWPYALFVPYLHATTLPVVIPFTSVNALSDVGMSTKLFDSIWHVMPSDWQPMRLGMWANLSSVAMLAQTQGYRIEDVAFVTDASVDSPFCTSMREALRKATHNDHEALLNVVLLASLSLYDLIALNTASRLKALDLGGPMLQLDKESNVNLLDVITGWVAPITLERPVTIPYFAVSNVLPYYYYDDRRLRHMQISLPSRFFKPVALAQTATLSRRCDEYWPQFELEDVERIRRIRTRQDKALTSDQPTR